MIPGSKVLALQLIPDCSALRAPAIVKTFVIRTFFCEKWLRREIQEVKNADREYDALISL